MIVQWKHMRSASPPPPLTLPLNWGWSKWPSLRLLGSLSILHYELISILWCSWSRLLWWYLVLLNTSLPNHLQLLASQNLIFACWMYSISLPIWVHTCQSPLTNTNLLYLIFFPIRPVLSTPTDFTGSAQHIAELGPQLPIMYWKASEYTVACHSQQM